MPILVKNLDIIAIMSVKSTSLDNNNKIYVANVSSGSVSVISGVSNALMGSITVGQQPVAIAVNSLTNRIYVANSASQNISILNGENDTSVTVATAENQPQASPHPQAKPPPTTIKVFGTCSS